MKKPIPALLSLFALLFIFHFCIILVYVQVNKQRFQRSYRQNVIQEVMNIIHMIQATPSDQLPQAINSLAHERVQVTLTDSPAFKTHVTDLTYWRISHLVNNKTSDITISLAVPRKQWVNVQAVLKQAPPLWPHFIVLFIELIFASIIIFYAWSVSRFIEPLKQFQIAARQLGVNIKPLKLEEYEGPKVVRETAQAMNKMQERIRQLINDRTVMLAAISHDLRTPITRLKLRAHLFDNETLTEKTIKDLDLMESMIQEILDYANAENITEPKRKLDLSSFLQTICNELKDLHFEVHYKPPKYKIPYHIRELALKRALTNLIQNACKYGKRAYVQIEARPKEVIIIISDEGPGIAKAEMEEVFTPFYRCEKSRSRQLEGTGLGMSIAQSAILAHNGDITLKNREQGGLEVRIHLPF